MAKESTSSKKVITTETKKVITTPSGASSPITRKKAVSGGSTNTPREMTFNQDNIKWLLISLGIVVLGYILMLGGKMPNYDTWDEKIIYSFTRTVLSPLVILSGLVLAVYSIFRNKSENKSSSEA